MAAGPVGADGSGNEHRKDDRDHRRERQAGPVAGSSLRVGASSPPRAKAVSYQVKATVNGVLTGVPVGSEQATPILMSAVPLGIQYWTWQWACW